MSMWRVGEGSLSVGKKGLAPSLLAGPQFAAELDPPEGGVPFALRKATIAIGPSSLLSIEDVEAIETYQNFKKVGLDRFVSYRNRLARVGQASPPPKQGLS